MRGGKKSYFTVCSATGNDVMAVTVFAYKLQMCHDVFVSCPLVSFNFRLKEESTGKNGKQKVRNFLCSS